MGWQGAGSIADTDVEVGGGVDICGTASGGADTDLGAAGASIGAGRGADIGGRSYRAALCVGSRAATPGFIDTLRPAEDEKLESVEVCDTFREGKFVCAFGDTHCRRAGAEEGIEAGGEKSKETGMSVKLLSLGRGRAKRGVGTVVTKGWGLGESGWGAGDDKILF